VNDELAEQFVKAHPNRFAGFGAVALQDPQAAAAELERAVKQLGFKGALINGYSQIADATPSSTSTSRPSGLLGAGRRAERADLLAPRDPCRASGASTRAIQV